MHSLHTSDHKMQNKTSMVPLGQKKNILYSIQCSNMEVNRSERTFGAIKTANWQTAVPLIDGRICFHFLL